MGMDFKGMQKAIIRNTVEGFRKIQKNSMFGGSDPLRCEDRHVCAYVDKHIENHSKIGNVKVP